MSPWLFGFGGNEIDSASLLFGTKDNYPHKANIRGPAPSTSGSESTKRLFSSTRGMNIGYSEVKEMEDLKDRR